MTTPADLIADIRTKLTSLPGVTIYVGQVPESVPTIPGTTPTQIRPYIVIWPGTADDSLDQPLGHCDGPGFDWQATLTVAARDTVDVLGVAFHVRRRLHRQDGPGGSMYLQQVNGAKAGPDPDGDLKPSRAFLPLDYTATTTH